MYVCICVVCMRVYASVCMRGVCVKRSNGVCMCVYAWFVCVCMRLCVCVVCVCETQERCVYVCVCVVCMRVYAWCVCMRLCVCVVCVYVCVHARGYLRECACVGVCASVHTFLYIRVHGRELQ